MKSSTESLCRICLEDGATIPIFKREDGSNSNLQNELTLCFNEKLEDVEGFPRNICNPCHVTLNTVYAFINKYKESCRTLQKQLLVVVKQEIIEYEDNNDIVYLEDDTFDSLETKRKKYIFEDGAHIKAKIEPLGKLETNEKKKSKKGTTIKKPHKKTKKTFKQPCKNIYFKNKTNKISSSLLEGEFIWNGEDWCKSPSDKFRRKEIVKNKPQIEKEKDIITHLPKPENKSPDSVLCDSCGETFRNREKLRLHEEKKHKNVPVTCPTCNVTLASQYCLTKHIKRKHSDSKDFICSKCGKAFVYKGDLTSHMKMVHVKLVAKKIKRQPCKLCGKDFISKKLLLIHERSSHTGERPATCSVCSASFFHEDYLKEHMRLHTGECPYECPVCGRGYAQLGNMKSHMRNHQISDLDPETLGKIKPTWYKFMKP